MPPNITVRYPLPLSLFTRDCLALRNFWLVDGIIDNKDILNIPTIRRLTIIVSLIDLLLQNTFPKQNWGALQSQHDTTAACWHKKVAINEHYGKCKHSILMNTVMCWTHFKTGNCIF